MSYPKWKFKGDARQVVETPEEEKALGAGWSDAPGGDDGNSVSIEDEDEDEGDEQKRAAIPAKKK